MPYNPWSGLILVAAPTMNPVSVPDAKAHMRIFSEMDDALVAGYISSATVICERQTRRAFMPQTWRLSLEQFPGRSPVSGQIPLSNPKDYYRWRYIELPYPPLQSIVSFNYFDTDDAQYSMSPSFDNLVGDYILNTDREPGRVGLPYAGVWPVTILSPENGVQVTFVCGYPAYSLSVNVDQNGVVTSAASPVVAFDTNLANTWVTLSAPIGSPATYVSASYAVGSVAADGSSMQLLAPSPNPLQFPFNGAGKLTGNCVPMPLRSAVLFLAAHLYENREPVISGRGEVAVEVPFTIDSMLSQYKIYGVG